ncbi:nucleolar protein 8 [Saguinus oedipus]|uniref:Nucleolar protein 8 n=1 Tax=Saguinus oedipus TaxID=9490 RepID=A0ABQ9UC01_SAGOE|nr:nucleolar protein 8 [Saguinus oedipus]
MCNSSDLSAKGKHSEDNEKRLAALEARQKAKEAQKKLVHNALENLDSHLEDKPTHIIFGSDSECETGETSTQELSHPGKELVNKSMGKTLGKLFDSSDDEESDSEDESNRFKIKPQFESRAGQKLMDLQSHFGADDRFRMDSRFLESDSEEEQEEVNKKKTVEEEELAEEKKKALNCFANQLKQFYKGSVAAKKFKDIIRYDPTKQDHATYERKREDKPKENTKDIKEETYRVETVKPGKIVWQEDPRFQDSSSEEEDVTEETDHEKSSPGEASLPERATTRFFFFSKNDERLQEAQDRPHAGALPSVRQVQELLSQEMFVLCGLLKSVFITEATAGERKASMSGKMMSEKVFEFEEDKEAKET